jgi:sigma-E factor negative regulatory protein RseB
MQRRGACCALWLLLAWAAPAAADEAADWFARMRQALVQQHYQGTLVYLRDGQLDALQIVHRAGGDGPDERLYSLSGQRREMSRRGRSARLSGGIGSVMPVLAAAGSHPPDLAGAYRLQLLGSDRMADRPTRLLEIRPRDGFRYGYRVWLDQASALPLKSIAIGPDGGAVEQWMFTSITLGKASVAAMLDEAAPGLDAAAPAATSQSMPPARWQVQDLPPGFERISLLRLERGGEHQVYSDGLATVSLYIEPLADEVPALSGLLRRGALSLFGRVLAGRQLTVIGEVPPLTVERIAQGVVPSR